MSIHTAVEFWCDDHNHESEDTGNRILHAKSKKAAIAALTKQGWTFHRDGRAFCPDCNTRLAEKMNASIVR